MRPFIALVIYIEVESSRQENWAGMKGWEGGREGHTLYPNKQRPQQVIWRSMIALVVETEVESFG